MSRERVTQSNQKGDYSLIEYNERHEIYEKVKQLKEAKETTEKNREARKFHKKQHTSATHIKLD